MSKSKTLLYFCLSFIGGIFFNSFLGISFLTTTTILILSIFVFSVFWQRKKIAIWGFCLLFLVFGIFWHQKSEDKIINNKLRNSIDSEEKISLTGQIVREPDTRENNIKILVFVEKKDAKILITTGRYSGYQYGDKLEIKGFLKNPEVFEGFNYKDYLGTKGVSFVMYYPEIKVLEKNQGNFMFAGALSFKNKIRETINSALSPPQSSIFGAVILGDKSQISDIWKQKLNIAGVRHITCVSGMHIIILSGILMSLGISFGLWRGQAFYFALFFLALFILMVGAPSSAVRAGIMGSAFLFSQKIGRQNSGGRILILAAALMLFQNPLLLKSDVGFQLSFLATAGIIYLMPIFQNWFKKIPNLTTLPLKNLLAMTLSAQVFTLPILIYNFGYISSIAPITNILIVPLLPYIMIFGFVFITAGIIWQPLGWLFSIPLWLLLTYVIKIIDWFSGIPWSSFNIENIHFFWLLFFYLILLFIIWRLQERQKLKILC